MGKRTEAVLPPKCSRLSITGRRMSTNNHRDDYTLHGQTAGDSDLSKIPWGDTTECRRMGRAHWLYLCQGRQDSRLPEKEHESCLDHSQRAILQGRGPSLHRTCKYSMEPPQQQTYRQHRENPEKGSPSCPKIIYTGITRVLETFSAI